MAEKKTRTVAHTRVVLSHAERVGALQVLPKQFNFAEYKVLNALRDELSFSEEELVEYGIVQVGNQVTWKKQGEKEFSLGPIALEILQRELKVREDTSSLDFATAALYEKLVLEGEDAEPEV